MKQQATGWEKIFVKHISDDRPVSRIYRELSQLNNNNGKKKKRRGMDRRSACEKMFNVSSRPGNAK